MSNRWLLLGPKDRSLISRRCLLVWGSRASKANVYPLAQHRTLPHFAKDDYSPEARGFVERTRTPRTHSARVLLSRHGLVAKVLLTLPSKTAETGCIQRRLVKALEDVSVILRWHRTQLPRRHPANSCMARTAWTARTSSNSKLQFFITCRIRRSMTGSALTLSAAEDENAGFREGVLQVGLDVNNPELQRELDTEMGSAQRGSATPSNIHLPITAISDVSFQSTFAYHPECPTDLPY